MNEDKIKEEVRKEITKKVVDNIAKEKDQGYLDKGLAKFTSRKLLVWMVSTGFLVKGIIPASDWILISLLWIGVQGALDLYKIRATVSDRAK